MSSITPLALFLFPACEPELVPTSGKVLSSDLRGNEWFVADLGSDEVVERYSLSDVDPGICEGQDNPVYCLLFESMPHQALDGREEIVFTWSALDLTDGDDDGANDLISRIAGVDRADGSLRWSIRNLDFSGLESSSCLYDAADPCSVRSDLEPYQVWDCSLHMTHSVWITEEDEDSLGMWVVDSRNSRLLHLQARRDDQCAVVDTLVDSDRHPDWDVYNSVNSLERLELDGETVLLMTVKGSFPDDKTGSDQEGGPSKGKILLWREDPLEQIWEFPPQTEGAESFVNTPHGIAWLERPSGERWVLFAHSLGRSDNEDFGSGSLGSVAVLRLDDDGPTYLYDAVLPPDQGELRFPRDVTPMPDGRVLVSDSGCLGDDCAYETGLWVLDLPDAEPTGKGGRWSVDHADQEFKKVEADAGPYLQAADMLYSTAWIE